MKTRPDIKCSGYSDDCASFEPLKSNDSEYDVPSKWYTLRLDGHPVGRIRLHYGEHGEWETQLIGTQGKFSLADDVPLKDQCDRVKDRAAEAEED
jgi:hypothetical protein